MLSNHTQLHFSGSWKIHQVTLHHWIFIFNFANPVEVSKKKKKNLAVYATMYSVEFWWLFKGESNQHALHVHHSLASGHFSPN